MRQLDVVGSQRSATCAHARGARARARRCPGRARRAVARRGRRAGRRAARPARRAAWNCFFRLRGGRPGAGLELLAAAARDAARRRASSATATPPLDTLSTAQRAAPAGQRVGAGARLRSSIALGPAAAELRSALRPIAGARGSGAARRRRPASCAGAAPRQLVQQALRPGRGGAARLCRACSQARSALLRRAGASCAPGRQIEAALVGDRAPRSSAASSSSARLRFLGPARRSRPARLGLREALPQRRPDLAGAGGCARSAASALLSSST